MQRKAKSVVICAIFIALTFVFGAIPYVFLIPVLLSAAVTDFKTSLITSTVFGFVSLMYAFMSGASGSLVAVAFVSQPWIPIVARIFVGPAAYGARRLTEKLIKKDGKLKKILPISVAATVGSLANTGFVVGLLVLTLPSLEVGGVTVLVGAGTMLISGLIELAVNNIILPPIALTLNKLGVINSRPKQSTENKEEQTAQENKESLT